MKIKRTVSCLLPGLVFAIPCPAAVYFGNGIKIGEVDQTSASSSSRVTTSRDVTTAIAAISSIPP